MAALWLSRLVALGIGVVLTVMGIGNLFVHVQPRDSPFRDVACAWIEIGQRCYTPNAFAWVIGFGAAGIAVLFVFGMRLVAWMRPTAALVAVAWLPHILLLYLAIWPIHDPWRVAASTLNVALFYVLAAPAIWWAASRERPPRAAATLP